MTNRRLYRSRDNKVLAGIFGGFGNYWAIDPLFLRLLFIFLSIITAFLPMAVIYLMCWMVIPLEPTPSQHTYSRLWRSRKDKKVAGICGGVAEFFNMDSTIVRLLFVVIGFFTGILPSMIAYIVAWMIIPQEPEVVVLPPEK